MTLLIYMPEELLGKVQCLHFPLNVCVTFINSGRQNACADTWVLQELLQM